jgi:hypothetical protein
MNFQRGGNIYDTIGIGKTEVLKMNREKFLKDPAVSNLYIDKPPMDRNPYYSDDIDHGDKFLNFFLDLNKSAFNNLDEFFYNYFDTSFFSDLKRNSVNEKTYIIRMRIRPQYEHLFSQKEWIK